MKTIDVTNPFNSQYLVGNVESKSIKSREKKYLEGLNTTVNVFLSPPNSLASGPKDFARKSSEMSDRLREDLENGSGKVL